MDFSVLIPTYNRAEVLTRTLEALGAQSFDKWAEAVTYEVIVIDDGSTDGTAQLVRELTKDFPVPLLYLSQPNQKQGAARNLGAKHARGDYLVFLGDDTIPAPEFLQEHYRKQKTENSREVVVIGYTPWPTEFIRTRFMEYIGEQGWQFGFSLIKEPDDVPFNFFYTSNLSISKPFFQSTGGFDEAFQEYGWEDVELSLRLKKKGMRLSYNPRAVAYHHHPTSIRSFINRQKKVGYSAWTFYQKHPEMDGFLNVTRVPNYPLRTHLKMWLLTIACRITEYRDRPDLSHYYPDLMSYYYNLGILEGRDG